MRKVSKSRADDEIISSTNGSITNDDGSENDNANGDREDINEADNGDSANASKSDTEEQATKEPSKKKSKSKSNKKKKQKKDSKTKEEDEDEDEEEYEVEKVIDSKKVKGKLHYLIRWKGYSADSDTWEPKDTLSCPDLINKYEEQKDSKPNGKQDTKSGKKRKGSKKQGSPSKKLKTEWDSENADENAEYEVEKILEVHHKKNGKREFLIHWKGWSNKHDSWEPENNLNCSELIKKFMDKVDSARSTESRSLRVAPGSTKRFTLQAPSSGRRLSKRQGQKQRVRYDNAE